MPIRILAALAAFTLLVGACSSDGTEDESGAPGSSAACHDDPVASSSDGEAVAAVVSGTAEANDLTSVLYRVTRGDEVVASGTYGTSVADVAASQSMYFRIGNIAFGHMGTMLLGFVDDGEASLEDTIADWLPNLDVPNADEVTLGMLVQNTSGYPDYVRSDEFVDMFLDDPFRHFKPAELIDIAMSEPPWYEPGAAWSYAHTNYVILGSALEAIGGSDLGTLLTEQVIDPAGLVDTAPALTPEVPDPALHSFSTEREVFEDTTFWNPSWQTAPGSVLTSTICDLAASAAAIGSGSLISDESYEELVGVDPALLEAPPDSCPENVCRQWSEDFYFGLGVLVASDWVYQGPLFGGASGISAYLPEQDLAVAVIAVSGQDSAPNTNFASDVWNGIAAELAPENVPFN